MKKIQLFTASTDLVQLQEQVNEFIKKHIVLDIQMSEGSSTTIMIVYHAPYKV